MLARRLSKIELTPALVVLAAITSLTLFLHLAVNALNPLGYFRDELYYIVGAQRLDWGYVDHPPLIALVTRAILWVPGDSLFVLRFLPALAAAATVFLTGLMARRLGAGAWGVAISSLAILIPPVILATTDFLSTIAFYNLAWVLCCYLLLRLIQTGDERLWLAVGVTLGVGLMTKHNIALLAIALVAGVLLTPLRSHIQRRWLWMGGLAAAVIVLPHLIWQQQNGWPVFEFAYNASTGKGIQVGPIQFLLDQTLAMSPVTLPIWLAGLVYFFFNAKGKRYRPLGYTFAIPFIILLATGSNRVDYLAPAYAVLMAGGGVMIERVARQRVTWLRPAAVVTLAIGGIVMLPGSLPVLPVNDLARFTQAVGLADKPVEQGKTSPLPQWWADRHGWDSMVAEVAAVHGSLPEEDRARAVIFTANYGEAGALELFGPERGLPPVISGHNSYHHWGTRGASGDVVIAVGFTRQWLEQSWNRVEQAGLHVCQYCMDYENDMPIYVVREPAASLEEMWPSFKHYE